MNKSGYVSILGKPNTGKSTLLNKLINEKISIVTYKPQTTRDNILGVLYNEEYQIGFIDTPGIHKVKDRLSKYMMSNVDAAACDTDLILYTVSAGKGADERDFRYIEKLKKNTQNIIVLLTKIDIADKRIVAENLKSLNDLNLEIIPISVHKEINLDTLVETIVKYLPEQENLFDEDFITDKSCKFLCSEILREKLMLGLDNEIPYGLHIIITKFEEKKNGTVFISADIICEKQNHKAIIIGRGGANLKNIATKARLEMEKLLGSKVMLDLYVKYVQNWRDEQRIFDESCYGKNNKI